MKNSPVARAASDCHAAKRHLLERKDCIDQSQTKPLRRRGVPLSKEGNHLPEIEISSLV